MSHPAQQTSLFPAVAEQSLDWARLVVPTEQITRLHSGGAEYIADFITADEETALLVAVDAQRGRPICNGEYNITAIVTIIPSATSIPIVGSAHCHSGQGKSLIA